MVTLDKNEFLICFSYFFYRLIVICDLCRFNTGICFLSSYYNVYFCMSDLNDKTYSII